MLVSMLLLLLSKDFLLSICFCTSLDGAGCCLSLGPGLGSLHSHSSQWFSWLVSSNFNLLGWNVLTLEHSSRFVVGEKDGPLFTRGHLDM